MPDRFLIELSRWDPRGLRPALRCWWRRIGIGGRLDVALGMTLVATTLIAAGALRAG